METLYVFFFPPLTAIDVPIDVFFVVYLHITEILKLSALGPDTITDGGTTTFGTHRALFEGLCASL